MADEPGKIEVQLAFLSGQETAAFMQMKEAMKTAAEFMKAFKAADFTDAAEKLVKAQKEMAKESARLQTDLAQLEQRRRTGGVAGALGQGVANLRRAAGIGGEPPEDTSRDDARRNADEARQKLADQQKEEKTKQQQLRQEQMTDTERAAQHARSRFGGRVPDLGEGDSNAWYNNVEALNPDAVGIRIPQYGELTVQDILGQFRQRALRRAQAATTVEDTERYGRRAASIDELSRSAGNVAGLQSAFRQIQRHVTQPAQGLISAFEMPGASLGFERQQALGFLPFSTPFSPAGAEGMRQQMDQFSMRFGWGINAQQAAAITEATATAGFSGRQGTDIRRSLMAPAVQRFGVDPNALIPFTQTLRTGTANIQDLNTVINQLGLGARAARMNVNEFAQAVSNAGEQAQSTGGTFMQGATFGQQFSASTGLGPSVGNTLLQNNVVQGYLAARTGLPGRLAGAASPLAQQRAIEEALRDRVLAYQGTLPSHREPIRNAAGQITGYETTSGQDAAIGAAAADLGLNQEQARAILNRRGESSVSNFMAASRAYLGSVSGGRDLQNAARNFAAHPTGDRLLVNPNERYRYNSETGQVERYHGGIAYGILHGGDHWAADKSATTAMQRDVYGGRLAAHRTTGPSSLRSLHELAMQAGVSQSDWREQVDKAHDPYQQIRQAQKLVQDQAVAANDPNAIKFTGPAAKFFEALVNKNKGLAGASDLSKSAVATSSAGPSPLTNQSNTSGSFGGLSVTP